MHRITRKDRIVEYLNTVAEPISARSVADTLKLGHAETCAILRTLAARSVVVRSGVRNAYRYQIAPQA